MFFTTSRARKVRRFRPTATVLEVRRPVSSLALLPTVVSREIGGAADEGPRSGADPDAGLRRDRDVVIRPFLEPSSQRLPEAAIIATSPGDHPPTMSSPAADAAGTPDLRVAGTARDGTGTIPPLIPRDTMALAPHAVEDLAPPPDAMGVPTPTPPVQAERTLPPGTIRPLALVPTPATDREANPDPTPASGAVEAAPWTVGSSRIGTSAYSGGGQQPGGSGNPGDPTVTVDGSNVIGGLARATVMSPGGETIDTVTWLITGAVEEQDYTNAEGKIVDFPYPKGPIEVNGGSSSISFFWDEDPGAHTVSAAVTYADPWSGGGTDSETVTIVQPTVGRFVADTYPLEWVLRNNGDPWGFKLGTWQPPYGFSLGASVALPNSANESGNYGYIQKISAEITITNEQSGAHTFDTGGLVLDNNPIFDDPEDHGWLGFGSWNSLRLNPGDTLAHTEWDPKSPFDTPQFPLLNANVGNQPDPPIEMELDVEFETYLVYRSGGGIWVGIGKVGPWTVSGHRRLDPTTGNWDEVEPPQPAAPAGSNTVTITGGAYGPEFVTWTNFFTNFEFSPPYPDPTFP